jgi:hypothetical protein
MYTSNVGDWPDASGAWHQIVITLGEDSAKVYLEGSLVMEGPAGANVFYKTTDLDTLVYGYLGRSPFWASGNKNLENARYYQFKIYDHALAENEIPDATALIATLAGNPVITGFTLTPEAGLVVGNANVAAGAVVGTFGSPLGGTGAFTYSLVSGNGDDDNADFTISGTELKVGAAAISEGGTKSVRVKATDTKDETFEKVCSFDVDAPGASFNHLKLHFDFNSATESAVQDATGAHTGTLKNSASVSKVGGIGVLSLGTGGDYFDLGSGIGELFDAAEDFSVATYFYIEENGSMSGNGRFPWNFSSKENVADQAPVIWFRARPGYLGVTNSLYGWQGWNDDEGSFIGVDDRSVLTNDSFKAPVPRGASWIHVIYTQAGNTGTLYYNGVAVKSKTGVVTLAALRAKERLTYGWLGRPPFEGDNYMENIKYADFRIYDKALEAADITALNIASTITTLNTGLSLGTTTVDSAKLKVKYEVNSAGDAFVNTVTGSTYSAGVLNSGAAIATVNTKKVVNLGATGWVTLDSTLGALLLDNEKWTIETYAVAPAVAAEYAALFSFNGEETIKGGAEYKGTLYMTTTWLSFRARGHGWDWANGLDTPEVNGLGWAKGDRWRHVAVSYNAGKVKVYLDGVLMQTEANSGGPATFAEALDIIKKDAGLTFNYLGRSPFHANGDATVENGQYYRFAVYNDALSSPQIAKGLDVSATLTALNGD